MSQNNRISVTAVTQLKTQITPAFRTRLLYCALVFLAVIAPPFLFFFDSPFVIVDRQKPLAGMVKIFLTTGALAFSIIALCELRKLRGKSVKEYIPIVIALLVLSNIFYHINVFPQKNFDYECYEQAAQSIVDGGNPYASESRPYLYPPLLAQLLAGAYSFAGSAFPQFLPTEYGEEVLWDIVFYLYLCAQFIAVLWAYFLCSKFLRMSGLNDIYASAITGTVLLFNTPLVQTIRLSQLNMWVLDLILLAIIYRDQSPVVRAIAIAIGAHLKLYTLFLLFPSILRRQFGQVLLAIFFIAVILLLQTNFSSRPEIWFQYIDLVKSTGAHYTASGVGIYSILHYTLTAIFSTGKLNSGAFGMTFNIIIYLLTALILAWFVIRFIKREKSIRDEEDAVIEGRVVKAKYLKLVGHDMDAIIMALLLSGFIWHHHLVLAIPVLLWAYLTSAGRRRNIVYVLAFIILCLPPMYILPLKYLQIIAVAALAYSCDFRYVPKS